MAATPPYRQPSGWRVLLGRHERGQSLVEMAIIMPVILLIMAGVFDFGRVIYAYVVVVNATREAAIAGAAAQMSDSELRTFMDDELARGGVNSGSAASVIAYTDKGSPPKQTLIIDLSYEIPLVIFVLPFSTVTVTSHAEMITFWN
ncbi:MAG: pilus assembly protein [Chloroflexi bacterium]|nr:pilus assembly protein [Chloroflexota bacterium]